MIFDLGFHNGNDTEFYLKKGHKVIAVEPIHTLVKEAKKKFKKHIDEGKLILINKAISEEIGFINFYIHPSKSDWSSCEQWLAERNGITSTIVSVDTISFTKLCEKYGIPHYVKVDTEGCEIQIAKELLTLKKKPKYVSFETSKTTYVELFDLLYKAGYKKFQLTNQLNNELYSSGKFGECLQEDKWFDYDELLNRYSKYAELKRIDNKELALGWLDVHASL